MATIYGVQKISCLQSNPLLNKIFYFCETGLYSDNGVSISSTTNWNKSQSNCKIPNSKENHTTDICELNKDTIVKTGIWTNIFRVEISSHVNQSNVFYNNKRIYLFILQHLQYTNTCLLFKPRPLRNYFLCSLVSGVGGTQNQC